MIFVVFGIVILIASFIIALISLTREKARNANIAEPEQKKVPKLEKDQGLSANSEIIAPQALPDVNLKKEEPFPWEIKLEDSRELGISPQEEASLQSVSKASHLSSQSNSGTKLRGEFSIKDIVRDN